MSKNQTGALTGGLASLKLLHPTPPPSQQTLFNPDSKDVVVGDGTKTITAGEIRSITSYITIDKSVHNVPSTNPVQNGGPEQATSSTSSIRPKESFTDLVEELKNLYQHYTLPTVAWMDEHNLDFEKYFIDLELTDSDESITIQDILKPVNNKKPRRILIEGQPGFGKTTLATKLAFDWSKGKEYIDFELVILVPLKQLGMHAIGDAIISSGNNEIRKMVDANASKTLLILDGLDEISGNHRKAVIEILYKRQHPRLTVIVFSRSNVFTLSRDERKELGAGISNISDIFYDKRVSIIGIRDTNSKKKFLNNICSESTVNKILSHFPFTLGLFDSPLYLMLASLIIDRVSTVMDFYKCLFNGIIKQSYLNRDRDISASFNLFDLDSSTNDVNDVIKCCVCEFGKLCVGKIVEGNFDFESDNMTEEVYKMGFLTKQKQEESRFNSRNYYEVFPFSIMEFASAFYLWVSHDLSENTKDSIVGHFFETGGDSQILPFLAGFIENENDLDWLLSEIDSYKWCFQCRFDMLAKLLLHCPLKFISNSQCLKNFVPSHVDLSEYFFHIEDYCNLNIELLKCEAVTHMNIKEADVELFSTLLMHKTGGYLKIHVAPRNGIPCEEGMTSLIILNTTNIYSVGTSFSQVE